MTDKQTDIDRRDGWSARAYNLAIVLTVNLTTSEHYETFFRLL